MVDERKNFVFSWEVLKNPKLLWIAAVLILGIVLMSLGNFMRGPEQAGFVPEKNIDEMSGETNTAEGELTVVEKQLEKRLEKILSQIDGAGKVSVSLVLETGPEYEYAVDVSTKHRTTEEGDQGGGSRVTTESDQSDELVLLHGSQKGTENPVVVKEKKPVVRGVLVVAPGAPDPWIRSHLSTAVQTLLDVEAHQVKVFPREER